MPKVPRPAQPDVRHNPLAEEYSPVQPFKQKTPKKRNRREEGGEHDVIGTKASRRILRIGQELAEEDEEEIQARYVTSSNPAFAFDSRFEGDVQSEEDDEEDGGGQGNWEDEEPFGDEGDQMVEEEVDVKDLDTFNRFNPPTLDESILRGLGGGEAEAPSAATQGGDGGGTNLADLILAKIAEFEASSGKPTTHLEGPAFMDEEEVELPPMAIEVYTQVGHILSRYKSGKLPKPFKLLPSLPPPMLAMIIPLTAPERWTPNAIYQATRLFVSSKSVVSQGFLGSILLDRVRDDIAENKKLNVHLYNALKKALYKPKEFFKGFLFPLVESGTCTLREAHIISSVLARVSIPVLHSAYALARLCEIAAEQMSAHTEAGGATNIFIKTLLEKRYALPYQTVDALVFHFLRFKMPMPGSMDAGDAIEGKLPVIWHQCLLAFAQRYRDEITEDQREALLDLLLVRGHKEIGPEVRRELLAGRGRGVVAEQPVARDVNGGDDTMVDV
jgi:essential nuclear protein 1